MGQGSQIIARLAGQDLRHHLADAALVQHTIEQANPVEILTVTPRLFSNLHPRNLSYDSG
jgi:hypothetical protein